MNQFGLSTKLSKSLKRRSHKLPSATPSPPRTVDIPLDIPLHTPSAPSSPESSQLVTCGQRPLIDYLEETLLTSFELKKHKTPTEKPKLTDSDFKFVKSLAGTVSTLTTAKDHITKQIASLSRAIQWDTPSIHTKSIATPHPHRELTFQKSLQDNWDRLNKRAAIAFTKLTLEEYTHQAEEVEQRLTKATKSAQQEIAEQFKNEQELAAARNLHTFFTRPRRGKKRECVNNPFKIHRSF